MMLYAFVSLAPIVLLALSGLITIFVLYLAIAPRDRPRTVSTPALFDSELVTVGKSEDLDNHGQSRPHVAA